MILVLFIAGGALALAVLAGVSIGDAAAALVGVPFPSLDPSHGAAGGRRGAALAGVRARPNTSSMADTHHWLGA
jgi:dolichol kinase